ncbi:16S rRNA (adenine(1518)-N(6)/adenine(1519)-N(6))-dimethyltransferase RsmA [Herbiconiux sp. L3-i23]|uniref:16S rRNA (adenine(1518)-N(6)/adenine(1519)-N(6))- dimethyltransferase RsmA n=1 Tax=Herbiconiux sp. L3-i23 TaxID=2905871 RepID=UPI00206E00DC|nr:16S rRNA (adenine(1518)-N(6)/adenine(1519)-N(6))-dimethyltransferase RsmA [Herbiconiux sp. L3-i23]BDI23642.1 ribosomal RNA small subunit methyltransferase A [Herbiconiux sp. L3-i23]
MSATPSLLGPAEVRELAARLDVTPTKKLGQNFVIDANTVRRIVRLAGVRPGDRVVEVGPGLGSLTLGILEAGAEVVAVEIDPRLAAELPATVTAFAGDEGAARLTVIESDALKVTALPDPARFVANLPYNVSVPVLLHFLEHFPSIRSGVVMVQSEVGERIAAAPGSKVYGSPSVKAAWYGDFTIAGRVGRQIFWPVPNVDSVLVGFTRDDEQPGDEALRRSVFGLVDAAFGQRRKMLRQALSAPLGSSDRAIAVLEAAGVDPTARGERLTIDDFLAIARADEAAAS